MHDKVLKVIQPYDMGAAPPGNYLITVRPDGTIVRWGADLTRSCGLPHAPDLEPLFTALNIDHDGFFADLGPD